MMRIKTFKQVLNIFILAAVVSFLHVGQVTANILQDGWHWAGEAEVINDEEMLNYMTTEGMIQEAHHPQRSTRSSTPVPIPPRIALLAKGMRYDPLSIFNYVRNNIDFVPYQGILKGAEATLLDKSGNDFDQAVLLYELLRAVDEYGNRDLDLRYVQANIFFGYDDVANWFGLGDDGGYSYDGIKPILPVIAENGISVCWDNPETREVCIVQTWVEMTDNATGETFTLYPGFKLHTYIEGMDLKELMDFSKVDLMNQVTAGMERVEGEYTRVLNKVGLQNELMDLSSELIETLREEHNDKTLKEIIGGQEVIEEELTELPDVLPCFAASCHSDILNRWTIIPEYMYAKVHIKYGSDWPLLDGGSQFLGIQKTLRTADIAGKRLTLKFEDPKNNDKDIRAVLRLEKNEIARYELYQEVVSEHDIPEDPNICPSPSLLLNFGGSFAVCNEYDPLYQRDKYNKCMEKYYNCDLFVDEDDTLYVIEFPENIYNWNDDNGNNFVDEGEAYRIPYSLFGFRADILWIDRNWNGVLDAGERYDYPAKPPELVPEHIELSKTELYRIPGLFLCPPDNADISDVDDNILPPLPHACQTTSDWCEEARAAIGPTIWEEQCLHICENRNECDNTWRCHSLVAPEPPADGCRQWKDIKFEITVDHPYWSDDGTYMDQTASYSVVPNEGAIYAFVSSFGGGLVNDDNIGARRKMLNKDILAPSIKPDSERVIGETLNLIGLNYLNQVSLANHILSEILGFRTVAHHMIGRMAQEDSFYIDVRNMVFKAIPKDGDKSKIKNLIYNTTLISSALEHGILEQLVGSEIPAISTTKIFELANDRGFKFFEANKSNWHSIKGKLKGYGSGYLSGIEENIFDYDLDFILTREKDLTLGEWSGAGYMFYSDEEDPSVAMIIDGGLMGGYPAFDHFSIGDSLFNSISSNPILTPSMLPSVPLVELQFGSFMDRYSPSQFDQPIYQSLDIPDIAKPLSFDPVDLASGAFFLDKTDLSIGGPTPMPLEFTRSYRSDMYHVNGALGYGWTHNYNIYLNEVSNGRAGFGLRKPLEGAAMLASMIAGTELMADGVNSFSLVSSALGYNWSVNQLTDNSVTINQGYNVSEFIRLPDGTFSSPTASTSTLVQNSNDTYSVHERFGTILDFTNERRIDKITDIDGNYLDFSYARVQINDDPEDPEQYGYRLNQVVNNFDHRMNFYYTDDNNLKRILARGVDDDSNFGSGPINVYYFYNNGDLSTYRDAEGYDWTYEYNGHLMTKIFDPLDILTVQNKYDSERRVKEQRMPKQKGGTRKYFFFYSGRKTIEQDSAGVTIYHFDKEGRSNGTENDLGHRSHIEYDGLNRVVAETDSRGNTTHYKYDKNHNLTEQIDSKGNRTINRYDGLHRLKYVTDPLGNTITNFYDDKHHLVKIRNAEGIEVETFYRDGEYGLPYKSEDGNNVPTYFTYGYGGQQKTVQVGDHPPVEYIYDGLGRLRAITDQVGEMTTYEYDDRGLLIKTTDRLGKETVNDYDEAGKLISVIDRNGDETGTQYTPSKKVDIITYEDGTTVDYVYDNNDQLLEVIDSIGKTSYKRDSLYRITEETNVHGQKVKYFYDNPGNEELLTKIQYPNGMTVEYWYDTLNRLGSVTTKITPASEPRYVMYSYDNASRLKGIIRFRQESGMIVWETGTYYLYDKASRLKELKHYDASNQTIAHYKYTLDNNGNRRMIEQDEPFAAYIPLDKKSFEYNDERNRLLKYGSKGIEHDDEGQETKRWIHYYDFDKAHRLINIRR